MSEEGIRPIHDMTRLGVWSRRLLYVHAGMAALSAIIALNYGPGFDNENGSGSYMTVSMLQVILYIVTGFIVLRWIYFADANAHAFGAQGMIIGPKMAVASYFVPIANLGMPFQSMREIWKATTEPRDWEVVKPPAIIGWWWLFWLLDGITGIAAFRLDDLERYPDAAHVAETLTIISSVLSVATALLLSVIIGRLTEKQQARIGLQAPTR